MAHKFREQNILTTHSGIHASILATSTLGIIMMRRKGMMMMMMMMMMSTDAFWLIEIKITNSSPIF